MPKIQRLSAAEEMTFRQLAVRSSPLDRLARTERDAGEMRES